MAEQEHHHHHHHHHKEDDATRFKRKSLLSLERRKKFRKWGLIILSIMAIILGILVVLAYTIG